MNNRPLLDSHRFLASVFVAGFMTSPVAFAVQDLPVDSNVPILLLAQSAQQQAEERAEEAEDQAEVAEERAEDQAEAAEETREDQAELAEERENDQAQAAEQRAETVDEADGQQGLRSSGSSAADEESAAGSANERTTDDWRGYGN